MRFDVVSRSGNASARISGRIGLIEPTHTEHQFVLENHLQIREEVLAGSCPIDRLAEEIELLKEATRHFREIHVPREAPRDVGENCFCPTVRFIHFRLDSMTSVTRG
jgi:hypothetical protein